MTRWILPVLIALSATAATAPASRAQSPAIYAPGLFQPKPRPEKPEEEEQQPQVKEKIVLAPGDIAGRARALSGDTLKIELTTFRLWGIVAPSMSDFGGYTSMQGLAALIGVNTVICAPTGNFQGSQRLARCRTAAGRDLATDVVARGWARDCPRQSNGTFALVERRAVVDVAGGIILPDNCKTPY